MRLCRGIPGNSYRVESMNLPLSMAKRLEVLGMTKGTSLDVINKKGRGILIIRVRGTRLALGRNITRNIEVCDYE